MPSVRVLLAGAALGLLPLLTLPGTAVAGALPHVEATGDPTPEPTASEPPAPAPSPTRAPCLVGCATPTPEPTVVTVTPTAVPTTAAPTASPTPVRTYTRPVVTARPQATRTPPPEVYATGEPIIGGIDVGTLDRPTSSPTASTVSAEPAAVQQKSSDPVSRLVWLAVGGAVLLGGGGALGLYLTRHA